MEGRRAKRFGGRAVYELGDDTKQLKKNIFLRNGKEEKSLKREVESPLEEKLHVGLGEKSDT